MEEYKGRHEKGWQEPRYFGRHEAWRRADDATGYGDVLNQEAFEILRQPPIQRTYVQHGGITVSGQPRRNPVRQTLSIMDRNRVHRAIPAEIIVKPYSPIWEKAPQAAYWLIDKKRRWALG